MTLRKLLALLLCLAMMLAAVGCGEAASTTDEDDDKPAKKSSTSVSTTQTGDEDVTTTTDMVTTTTQRDKDTTAEPTTTTTTGSGTAAALPDDEMILGDWETEIEFGDMMDYMGDETSTVNYFDFSTFAITMTFSFEEDGTARQTANVKDAEVEELTAIFLDGMDEYLQAMLRDGGYSSAEELCEANGCSSMEELREKMAELLAQLIVSSVNLIVEEVTYRFEDGYLFFTDAEGEEEQYNYTLTATRLLMDYVGEVTEENESVINAIMPLTFKKVG